MQTVRVATRGSELALWQAHKVASMLPTEVEIQVVETQGDQDQHSALSEIGGQGVFVKEVQQALLDGQADLAVHSAKDLPAETPEGLELLGVAHRDSRLDTLVGNTLADIPQGGTVASGSARRKAQLAALRPDLEFADLRGNIRTRLEKSAEFDAVVMGAAALNRLGLQDMAAQQMTCDQMLPQVGQGAIAVESRVDYQPAQDISQVLLKRETSELLAERSFLRMLGAGCTTACAAMAEHDNDNLTLTAALYSEDGQLQASAEAIGDDPELLGTQVGQEVLLQASEIGLQTTGSFGS